MAERPPTVGTPSLLRAINARTILERIQRTGPVSRAQVAQGQRPLQADRLARPHRPARRRAGPGGRPLQRPARAQRRALRAQPLGRLGGGHRRRPPAGPRRPGRHHRRPWSPAATSGPSASSARTLIGQIGAIAHGLATEAGIGWDQVHHVTVGSPGVFEPTRGAVTLAPNLPGWGRQGLLAALRDELGDRIGVENDVNLAAEGERWRGLARTSATSASSRSGRASAWAWCWTASCTGGPAAPPARSATCPSAPTPTTPRSAAGAPSRRRSTAPRWSGPPGAGRPGRVAQRQEGVRRWPARATRWPRGWSRARRGGSPSASPW